LHLFQVVDRGSDRAVLQHWLWNGQSWLTEQSQDLSNLAASQLGGLTAALSPQGEVGVSLYGDTKSQLNGLQQTELFFTSRVIEIPGTAPTPLPPLTPTPLPYLPRSCSRLPIVRLAPVD
jgi:hypothetical protein